jgi:hypothetical protein
LKYEAVNGKSNHFTFYLGVSKDDKKELRVFLESVSKINPMVKIDIDL